MTGRRDEQAKEPRKRRSARPAVGFGDEPSPPEAHAVAVREMFGLPCDLSHVRRQATARGTSWGQLGIPLTPAEVDTIRQRDQTAHHAGAAEAAAAGTDTFAGVWMDNRIGKLAIAFCGPGARARYAAVRQVLPGDARTHFVQADHPVSLLEDLASEVQAAVGRRTPPGSYLRTAGIDLPLNRVVLTVMLDAPADAEELLERRYGQPGLVITREMHLVGYR